jgi:hypothetical protein
MGFPVVFFNFIAYMRANQLIRFFKFLKLKFFCTQTFIQNLHTIFADKRYYVRPNLEYMSSENLDKNIIMKIERVKNFSLPISFIIINIF